MLKQKNTPRGQGGCCSGSPSPPSALAGLQARIGEAFGAPPRQSHLIPSSLWAHSRMAGSNQWPETSDRPPGSRACTVPPGQCCCLRSAQPPPLLSQVTSLWYTANSGPDPPPWLLDLLQADFFFPQKM